MATSTISKNLRKVETVYNGVVCDHHGLKWVANVGDYSEKDIYSAFSSDSNLITYFAKAGTNIQLYVYNTLNESRTTDIYCIKMVGV